MPPSHPTFWSDSQLWQLFAMLGDLHGWLLVGWLGFSFVLIALVNDGGDR